MLDAGGRIAGPKSLKYKVDLAIMLRKTLGMRQFLVSRNRLGAEIVETVLLANKMGCVGSKAD
jgi:hypothetical protein